MSTDNITEELETLNIHVRKLSPTIEPLPDCDLMDEGTSTPCVEQSSSRNSNPTADGELPQAGKNPRTRRKYTWTEKCEAAKQKRSEGIRKANSERARKAREYAKMKEETDKLENVVDKHVREFAERLNLEEQIKKAVSESLTIQNSVNTIPFNEPLSTIPEALAGYSSEPDVVTPSKRASNRFVRVIQDVDPRLQRFKRFS